MNISHILLSMSLAICFSGTSQAQLSAYGSAANVNGVEISNAILERNFEEYQRENDVNIAAIRYPDRIIEMRRDVLDQLIDQELVWQVVQARDLVASPEETETSVEDVRAQFDTEDEFLQRITIDGFTLDSYHTHAERVVSVSNYMQKISSHAAVSSEEVHEFYVNNPDKLQLPETVRARHILLKVHPNANTDTRESVQQRMDSITEQLAGGADFSTLAVRFSEDSSASQGGDLGYFQHGQMVKPFDDAVFALSVGETSNVVRTVYGLHLIKLEDRQPSQMVAEEAAAEQIYAYLLEVKQREAIRDELSTLRANADIDIWKPQ